MQLPRIDSSDVTDECLSPKSESETDNVDDHQQQPRALTFPDPVSFF